MTKEQVRNWIVEIIKSNPRLAKEYKSLKLSRLNAELKDNVEAFNREGSYSYRNPGFSRSIIKNRDDIAEIENKTDEELLIDDFVLNYGDTKSTEEVIEYIKSLTDEDHYIEGVFQGTTYNIHCEEDLDAAEARHGEDLDKIRKIYERGLSRRDEYIKKGKKSHQEFLEKKEAYVREYQDIDMKGPDIIQKLFEEEEEWKKLYCRSLAQSSVVDAFVQMGVIPTQKQAEQIDKIIEMHDPSVVESAMQAIRENPTENMIALTKNISETPAQSRKELRMLKALDIFQLATGGILTALGIVGMANGNPSYLTSTLLGVGNLGLGLSGIMRHRRKTDNLDQKEVLMSGCIEDLLNEVVLQETFNRGLEGQRR